MQIGHVFFMLLGLCCLLNSCQIAPLEGADLAPFLKIMMLNLLLFGTYFNYHQKKIMPELHLLKLLFEKNLISTIFKAKFEVFWCK